MGGQEEQLSLFEDPAPGDPERCEEPRTGPRVVHCKEAPAGSFVYVGRPSPLGNPFALRDARDEAARDLCVSRYRTWFLDRVESDGEFRRLVESVRGRDLGCWCKTRRDPLRSCHGDVILEWLEANP